ncbi:MAG: glycosyltransferase family 4 protein [Elusimicrobiota bacterium]
MQKSRKLRVAVSALSANSYGGDSYFRALLPALMRHAGEVECVLLTRDGRYDSFCNPEGAVKPVRCALPKFFNGPLRILWEQKMLPSLARELEADVIYTANSAGILYSSQPCVIAVRNMEPLLPALSATSAKFKVRHALLRWVTTASAMRAARVIAVSEYVRETMGALGIPDEKIDVIYHGIDDIPERKTPRAYQSGTVPYVAAAAKFIRYANLETLFKAFARMKALGYAGELRFAGGAYDAAYELEMRELVRSLGIESSVRFLGYVARADVHGLMSGCDVFLFSSTIEACPFTLLEALRCGAAIVSANSKPMPEFCADAAVYVNPKDGEAMGREAYGIAKNPQLSAFLRGRALERSRFFRWEESVKKLLACWEKAARQN